MISIFLSPHSDDETLFAAFTLMREQPLVVIVTDSYVQFNRGDGVTAEQRWQETRAACSILGCTPFRLGLRDDALTENLVTESIRRKFPPEALDRVYAPALQYGHPHHDLTHRAAVRVYQPDQLVFYCTYSHSERFYANTGARAVVGSLEERSTKDLALACYRSQQARSWRHFEAVKGQPEWLTP